MSESPTAVVVTRRALVGGLSAVVVGGVVGFFVARNSAAARGSGALAGANGYGYTSPKHATPKRLAVVDQIPLDGGVVIGSAGVVLTRDSAGVLHAFSATCTHQGCTVSSVRDGTINCPCHGSRFNADTGAVVRGPASRPLPAVSVTINGGVVYAG